MPYILYVYCSFSIAIAAIIGGLRFSRIDPAYYPFIFFLWLATTNEIVTYSLSTLNITTNISNNVYVLLEAWLLIWQARKWNAISSRTWYWVLQFAITICWLVDVISSQGFYNLHSVFRIIAGALFLVLFIGH